MLFDFKRVAKISYSNLAWKMISTIIIDPNILSKKTLNQVVIPSLNDYNFENVSPNKTRKNPYVTFKNIYIFKEYS